MNIKEMSCSIQFDKKYFPYPLMVKFIDGHLWELLSDFEYHRDNGEIIKVSKGFLSDFASIPQIFWSWIPPTGEYGPGALIHDYLCDTKPFPYKKIDYIFYEAMAKLGVPYLKRTVMYLAVKIWHCF